MRAAAFVQLRCVGLYPAPDATGIHFHAALRQKFSDVLVGEGIAYVPADAQNNHLAREMASFERMGRGDWHGFLPYQIASPISAMEPFVSPQADLAAIFAAQSLALEGQLLSVHHHESILSAPPLCLATRRSLIPAAGQSFGFLRDRQQDQLQTCLTNQFAGPLLGQGQDLDHWQQQLHDRVLLFSPPPYSLYGTACGNLVWFFH